MQPARTCIKAPTSETVELVRDRSIKQRGLMRQPHSAASRESLVKEAVYVGLLVAGIALPYAQALPWLREHGLDLRRFGEELFANRISGFFGWDVIISAATLISLSAIDDELPPSQRVAVATGAMGGASVGLPLYLWLRERHRRLQASR